MARSELESGKEELRSKQPMLSCLQLQIAVRAGKDYLHLLSYAFYFYNTFSFIYIYILVLF